MDFPVKCILDICNQIVNIIDTIQIKDFDKSKITTTLNDVILWAYVCNGQSNDDINNKLNIIYNVWSDIITTLNQKINTFTEINAIDISSNNVVTSDVKILQSKYKSELDKWMKECCRLNMIIEKDLEDKEKNKEVTKEITKEKPIEKPIEETSKNIYQYKSTHDDEVDILKKQNQNMLNANKIIGTRLENNTREMAKLIENNLKLENELNKQKTANTELQELVNTVVTENTKKNDEINVLNQTPSEAVNKMRGFETEFRKVNKWITCKKCYKFRVERTLWPCGHMMCQTCGDHNKHKLCPICSKYIEHVFPAYLNVDI
jgi:hypothetical protein